ncbi:hypothetical protein ACQ4PT_013217 [Festuca glaucescens]
MAESTSVPPRGANPPPPLMHQPVLLRSTLGRTGAAAITGVEAASGVGAAVSAGAVAGAGSAAPAKSGQGASQHAPAPRFQPGGGSGTAGRFGERRYDGFDDQGFGGFQEGYYEGNNGYGNGYGSQNRGNFRPHPYNNNRQQWNRNFNNNFRGSGRYNNNNNNRYQRRFNVNENPQVDATAQGSDASLVTSASQRTEAVANVHQMDNSSVENAGVLLSARAQIFFDKMQCLKCTEFGHFADACSAVLCIYCEKISHESKDCPLLSMPKPVAITYGVSRNELMFHEVPASSEWIIPGNHQWDLTPTDDGAFKALFPSKANLVRMTKIINVPVPGTNMFLKFEEWSAADLDRFYITPVWVRVHGVCYKERCDYLLLFGVGSLIGKTKEVDIVFTRAHRMVRMLVEVTRVEHILTTTVDHMYDGQGYGLIFKLESEPIKEQDDVVMNEAITGDDARNEEGKGKVVPKGTDRSTGGDANSTPTANQDPPKQNAPQNKQ